jgi:type 1 glutamine amidotransferase
MAKAKALLLTNGGHAKLGSNRAILEDILRRQADLDLYVGDGHDELTRRRLGAYDVIVDYSGHAPTEPTDEQLSAIMDTVESGTSYIGLHVASLPFKSQLVYRERHGGWPMAPEPDDLLSPTRIRYFAMLGSAFITHGPIEPFTLHLVDREHPITRGLEDVDVVDELYVLGGDRGSLRVLGEARGEPLLYVKEWGKGKVHYNGLGHDGRALGNPGFQRLLKQAVVWALE